MDTLFNLESTINPKGVFIRLLKVKEDIALILVYRESKLKHLLKSHDVRGFLAKYGYTDFRLDYCLDILQKHANDKNFPHEIGVFLGYPLCDIQSFIDNKGKNYKCVGCWKAYFNESEAKKVFALYNKCTKIYCNRAECGYDINRLTVAI